MFCTVYEISIPVLCEMGQLKFLVMELLLPSDILSKKASASNVDTHFTVCLRSSEPFFIPTVRTDRH